MIADLSLTVDALFFRFTNGELVERKTEYDDNGIVITHIPQGFKPVTKIK